jgi:hypothetical protein
VSTTPAGSRVRDGGMARARRWLSRVLVEPDYPEVAVEVRPRAIAAVRLAREGRQTRLGAAAVVDLPQGALDVTLARSNIADPEAFRSALSAALERAGALSGGEISVVLPDPAVRLVLVDGAGLKGRRSDAEETIRFRLHKALPFDVRSARLAWDGPREERPVLAVVALEEVVRSYEEALESLGFHPGLVEASSPALASLVGQAPGDRLLVNWDDGYVSFLLLRGDEPILVRTLPGEAGAGGVARQARSTLQFYRDRLGGDRLDDVVVRSAACPGDEALAVLGPALECEPRLLQPWVALGALEHVASAQAVAAAAASALRRVA